MESFPFTKSDASKYPYILQALNNVSNQEMLFEPGNTTCY